MKKSLITLAVLAAISTPSQAEQAIERLVVTANRTAQEQMDILGSVIVIERDEIALLQPNSLTDLLQRSAGISFTQQGGAAQSTSLFIRGTNSNHVLVLVDGVRVGSATTGNKAIESINPSQIERIEVVKGPRAALYGSGAIGGVIQIFTRELAHGEAELTLEAGSFQHKKAEIAAGFDIAGSSNTLSLSHESSDGFSVTDAEPDDDGYERSGASLKGNQQFGDLSINWLGLLEKGDYDYDGSWVNQASYKNHLLGLGANWQWNQGEVDLQLAQSSDRSENYLAGNPPSSGSLYQTKVKEVKLKLAQQLSEEIQLLAGTDWQNEEVNSTSAFAVNERILWGSYLSLNSQVEQFLLDASVRYDDIEQIGNEFTYNLSGGIEFKPDWLLGLNYGTGFKAPTFNDLYDPWGGNAELKPERSNTTELFVKGEASGTRLEIAIYHTEIKDLIEWHPIEPGSYVWQPSNVANASIKGIDLSLQARAFAIDWLMNATFLDTEDKATGLDLIRRPEQQLSFSGSYQYNNWDFTADLNYNGPSFDTDEVRLSSYTLLNGYAAYRLNDNITLRFYGRNLLDKTYQSVKDYNTPGRELGLSASFTL